MKIFFLSDFLNANKVSNKHFLLRSTNFRIQKGEVLNVLTHQESELECDFWNHP